MQTFESRNIPSNWSSGDVVANGVRLHYTRTGGPKPPLVLAHGFSDDGLCWTPVAQALESEFDVVMVDARGHGGSQAPENGYDTMHMAEDLAGVITALELESPFILGHSMGAATALTLAGLYPQMPRAIMLEDPPALWKKVAPVQAADKPRGSQWQSNMRAWILDLQNQSREELIEKQRRTTPSWSELEIELWADAHLCLSLNVVNGRETPSAWDVDLLANISCPVLLITADAQKGALVTEADALSLKEMVPQLKVAHISGAGHSVHREGFSAFMGAVHSFLEEVHGAPAML